MKGELDGCSLLLKLQKKLESWVRCTFKELHNNCDIHTYIKATTKSGQLGRGFKLFDIYSWKVFPTSFVLKNMHTYPPKKKKNKNKKKPSNI
jgi:hypothetical protein